MPSTKEGRTLMDLNLNKLYADKKIDVECDCGKTFSVSFSDIEKDGSEIICPFCQAKHVITHDEETKKTLADSEKTLNDFNKAAKKLGLKFR